MVFAYGTKTVAAVLAASRPMSMEDTKTRYLLQIPWDQSAADDEIRLCWALAADRATAHAQAVRANERFEDIMRGRIEAAVRYSRHAPEMEIEPIPAAAEFARTMPAFAHSTVFAETDKEACARAAIYKYAYFDWDQTYAAKGFVRLGDYATAKKLLRYTIFLPQIDGDFTITPQLMITVQDLVARSGDMAFLREVYPTLKRCFLWANRGADAKTGMVPYADTSGVDDPAEIGIKGLVWPSCYNGWWYDACRADGKLRLLLGR